MRRILAVAAESREFAGILRRSGKSERLPWPVDFARRVEFGGRTWVLVANGPGPSLARAAGDAASCEDFDACLSVGYCGALDPGLQAGQIVAGTRVRDAASGESFETLLPEARRSFASGSIISIDRVVRTVAEKRRFRDMGGTAVEMEAAAVAALARIRRTPFFCIRVVTDTASEAFNCDFNEMRDSDGRFSRLRILMEAVRRPTALFPELWKIDSRCRRASELLGEFLEATRFERYQ